MSRIFHNVQVGLDEELEDKLQWLMPDYGHFHILRQSVDARRRHSPHFIYSVELFAQGEEVQPQSFDLEPVTWKEPPPLIIGAGPAGLFAALRLVERGIPCKLFEQGSDAVKRMKSIVRFWRYGELQKYNNVCFGEGGAGLYSDGKLITRIKSTHIPYVMDRLVKFGAPEEIRYLANPHVGSDRIRRVIPKLRHEIQKLGGEIFYDTPVSELLFEGKKCVGLKTKSGEIHHSPRVILACGHSAEDMFQHLAKSEVFMEGKSFAVGLRIEHPQAQINKIQYREHYAHPKLGAANYRLAHHNNKTDVGVYSFCMCPGGYVLSSGTEQDGVVSNGMSNYNRNSPFANAAIVATIDHEKSFGNDTFGGMKFRRNLEQTAYNNVLASGGSKELPAQRLVDFLEGKKGDLVKTSSPSGVSPVALHRLFPEDILDHLRKGLEAFDHNMKGFISKEAQLHGVESRTSCPIRITRDRESLQSLSHEGLYPTGEGAGYAGGITSAACDGIKVAEVIAKEAQ